MPEPGIGIGLGIGVGTLATSYTASGVYTGAAGEISVLTKAAQPIYFYTNDTERARITETGVVLVGVTTPLTSEMLQVVQTNVASYGAIVRNTNAAPGNSHNVRSIFGSAAPNDTSALFYSAGDTGGNRFFVYSNGGIANFSANNANLSDADVKADITPYDNKDLDALEHAFRAVNWCKFKYRDQSHTDWNHGYLAQDIEKAFAATAPELVDQTTLGVQSAEGPPRKCVYDNDLTHIGLALLARALKRIEALEAKLSAAPAGAKHRHS